eukprot:TRINITY_DN4113_c0_g1_i1.p1 TRINITY_DN4113_c0_g1~~TRINITY_DN4113_c0_g1_i1.p1  ORF type:complete len:1342 (-),score=414.69 TRINITY_DN4113_c0_g1_i1:444-4469(-)
MAIGQKRLLLSQQPRKSVAYVPEGAVNILGEYLPVAPSSLFPDMMSCPLYYHVIGAHEITRHSKQVNGPWSIYFDPSDGSAFSEPGWWIIEEDFGKSGLFWASGGSDHIPKTGWQSRGFLGYYEVCLAAETVEGVRRTDVSGATAENDSSQVMNLLGTCAVGCLRGVELLVNEAVRRIETYQEASAAATVDEPAAAEVQAQERELATAPAAESPSPEVVPEPAAATLEEESRKEEPSAEPALATAEASEAVVEVAKEGHTEVPAAEEQVAAAREVAAEETLAEQAPAAKAEPAAKPTSAFERQIRPEAEAAAKHFLDTYAEHLTRFTAEEEVQREALATKCKFMEAFSARSTFGKMDREVRRKLADELLDAGELELLLSESYRSKFGVSQVRPPGGEVAVAEAAESQRQISDLNCLLADAQTEIDRLRGQVLEAETSLQQQVALHQEALQDVKNLKDALDAHSLEVAASPPEDGAAGVQPQAQEQMEEVPCSAEAGQAQVELDQANQAKETAEREAAALREELAASREAMLEYEKQIASVHSQLLTATAAASQGGEDPGTSEQHALIEQQQQEIQQLRQELVAATEAHEQQISDLQAQLPPDVSATREQEPSFMEPQERELTTVAESPSQEAAEESKAEAAAGEDGGGDKEIMMLREELHSAKEAYEQQLAALQSQLDAAAALQSQLDARQSQLDAAPVAEAEAEVRDTAPVAEAEAAPVAEAEAPAQATSNELAELAEKQKQEIMFLQGELHNVSETYEQQIASLKAQLSGAVQAAAPAADGGEADLHALTDLADQQTQEILSLREQLLRAAETHEQQIGLADLADKQKQEIHALQVELRTMAETYEHQVLDLQAQISATAPDQGGTQAATTNPADLHDKQNQAIQALRDELYTVTDTYEQQIASLQAQLASAGASQSQTEAADSAEVHKQEIARLETELMSSQSVLQQHTEAHKDAVDEAARLRDELASTAEAYEKDIAGLRWELSKAFEPQQASQDLSSTVQSQQQQISDLEGQLAEARAALDQAAQSHEEALEEAKKSASNVQGVLSRHVVQIEAKLQQQTEAGKEAQAEAEKLRDQLTALETSTAERGEVSERTASELLQTIEQLKGELAQATASRSKEKEDMPNVTRLMQHNSSSSASPEGPALPPTVLPRPMVHAVNVAPQMPTSPARGSMLSDSRAGASPRRLEQQDLSGRSSDRQLNRSLLGSAQHSTAGMSGVPLTPDRIASVIGGGLGSVDGGRGGAGAEAKQPQSMPAVPLGADRISSSRPGDVHRGSAVLLQHQQQSTGSTGPNANPAAQPVSGLPRFGSEIAGSQRLSAHERPFYSSDRRSITPINR